MHAHLSRTPPVQGLGLEPHITRDYAESERHLFVEPVPVSTFETVSVTLFFVRGTNASWLRRNIH